MWPENVNFRHARHARHADADVILNFHPVAIQVPASFLPTWAGEARSCVAYAHLDDRPVFDAARRIGALIADAMGEDHSLNYNTMCDTKMTIYDR
jgi:hypothetical protein